MRNDPNEMSFGTEFILLMLMLFAVPPMVIYGLNGLGLEIAWTWGNWWAIIVLEFALRIATVKLGRKR